MLWPAALTTQKDEHTSQNESHKIKNCSVDIQDSPPTALLWKTSSSSSSSSSYEELAPRTSPLSSCGICSWLRYGQALCSGCPLFNEVAPPVSFRRGRNFLNTTDTNDDVSNPISLRQTLSCRPTNMPLKVIRLGATDNGTLAENEYSTPILPLEVCRNSLRQARAREESTSLEFVGNTRRARFVVLAGEARALTRKGVCVRFFAHGAYTARSCRSQQWRRKRSGSWLAKWVRTQQPCSSFYHSPRPAFTTRTAPI